VTNNLSKGAIDMVFLLGERMKSLAAALNQTKSVATHGSYATHDELWQKLKTVLEPGDLILIKGSRSMRMEQILERITG
jgi:UDP-N-acetylmuramoyl-tripeptide--D-alanyl-D-alanine ligase